MFTVPPHVHRIGRREFDFSRQVAVMAVINRTPDSFFDQGATFALDAAVGASLRAADAGADWLDIGGVPFGRGPAVSTAEEIDRVAPVVEQVARQSDVVISVDTNNAAVAAAAIDAGAAVINDTSGLGDPDMASVIAKSDAYVVVTHSVGPPRVEKPAAYFDDVVADVRAFLVERVERAVEAGIPRDRIIIDPGHDLDKNTLHSLEITRRLDEDFVGEVLDREKAERLVGSLAAMVMCVERGARILRMHDVPASVDAVRMIEAVMGWRAPVRLVHNTHPTHNV
jgi:dihydropteroate synthase